MRKTGKCSICGGKYDNYGNNSEPVNSGRCCDKCNTVVVITVRLYGQRTAQLMSELGSKTSPAKAAAARANGKKGGRKKTV